MTDASLDCELREALGSRNSRKLRAHGRMVGSLQADADSGHVNLHFDEASFHAARRAHVHLFDLNIGGKTESAIVNELQWDAFGDTLLHVEFKRVTRGQKTESVVPLKFKGTPAGILQHDLNEIHITSLPSQIPDAIVINVDGLEAGTHVKAGAVETPEGVELVIDPDTDIAVITDVKGGGSDEPAEGEGEGEAEGEGAEG